MLSVCLSVCLSVWLAVCLSVLSACNTTHLPSPTVTTTFALSLLELFTTLQVTIWPISWWCYFEHTGTNPLKRKYPSLSVILWARIYLSD